MTIPAALKPGWEILVDASDALIEAISTSMDEDNLGDARDAVDKPNHIWSLNLIARMCEVIPEDHLEEVIQAIVDAESARCAFWGDESLKFLLSHGVTVERIRELASEYNYVVVNLDAPPEGHPGIEVVTEGERKSRSLPHLPMLYAIVKGDGLGSGRSGYKRCSGG